ncbi:DNA glycosylase [Hypoxylon sp. NC0597]|nr:DNA glycosylase [Hypoxylon sp. NC0597]
MAPRGRKAKAQPAPALPHGMGLDLSARAEATPPVAEAASTVIEPYVTRAPPMLPVLGLELGSPSIVTFKTNTDTLGPGIQSLIQFRVSRPTRSTDGLGYGEDPHTGVKPTEEQPDQASLKTQDSQTSGRQLRPRKSKATPASSGAEVATSSSAVGAQIADKQDDKNAPASAEQESNPDGSEPKPKKAKKTRKKARKTKDNPYGLTPGESPFPEWQPPSAEQCEEVYNILKAVHPDVKAEAPEVVPAPSLEVTGCGEVPSVLDALLRTYLSGAVTMRGSNKMLENLAARFGTSKDGIGKASIDWNNVRLSPREDLVAAIHEGGLANIKAKNIKEILDMVYQENIERRESCLEEKKSGEQADVSTAEETGGQPDSGTQINEQNILSLEHIRSLSVDGAMKQFTKYPGIGVKTSACVILFCLQMPCFAVDTHVHRFAKWLGWAPETATPDDVFSHLEVRCPDGFKYGLHQLFIRHGQNCGKCNASTAEGTDDWNELDDCPLEGLIHRLGKRKSKAQLGPPPKKRKGGKKGEIEMQEGEELIPELENVEHE